MKRTIQFVLSSLAALTFASTSQAAFIAYNNAAVTPNQDYGGSLGLDFTVNSPILITALGAFIGDNIFNLRGHDGQSGVTVAIFSTTTGLQVGQSVNFAIGNGGTYTVVGGDAFASVTPFLLANGSYSVVAANDINYNSSGGANLSSTLDSGGSLISFAGGGRYTADRGPALVYPTIVDGGPVNRYDAGTFQFTAAAVPEPTTVVLLGLGAFGLALSRRRRS